jgi:hypothetical protein
MDPSSTPEPTFDETTIALLTATAKHYGGFIYPIIRCKRTGRTIDGHHRLEVVRRLKEKGVELGYAVKFEHTETDEEIAIMAVALNRNRRPWNTFQERLTQAQMLADQIIPGGRGEGGRPSTRQIAKAMGVGEATVRRDLKEGASNDAVPKTPAPQPISPPKAPKATKSDLVREELRALCRQHGHTKASGLTTGAARAYLKEHALASIPAHLQPKTKATQPSPSNVEPIPPVEPTAPAPSEGILPWNTAVIPASHPAISDRSDEGRETDSDGDNDYDKITRLRQRVSDEVQQSDRPADFKESIQLLARLAAIIRDAWYRKQPEPWNHHDWAHVSSEIHCLNSLAGQRAEETARDLLEQMDAVAVRASRVG